MRWLLVIALLVVLIVGLVPAASAQVPDTPAFAARGPHPVGVRDFIIEDAERPLDVTVWYPALNPGGAPETTSYLLGSIFPVPGQALRDAAPDVAGGPYPLVIFSHGFGGFRAQSTYLTEHLASHGFVVMSADHPGSTLFDLLGDNVRLQDLIEMVARGSTPSGEFWKTVRGEGGARALELISVSLALRPLDVLREIAFAEALTARSGALAGIIDTGRIAVSGHSFGGYTAAAVGGARLDMAALRDWCADPVGIAFSPGETPAFALVPLDGASALNACAAQLVAGDVAALRGLDTPPSDLWPPTTDPRVQAVLLLAPWNMPIFGAEGLAALDVPLMVQVGAVDSTTPPERDAYLAYSKAGSGDKALVVFEGAGHLLFANGGLGVDDPAWDMDAAHALVNHFAVAFLRAALDDDAEARAALESGALNFAGVLYDRMSGE